MQAKIAFFPPHSALGHLPLFISQQKHLAAPRGAEARGDEDAAKPSARCIWSQPGPFACIQQPGWCRTDLKA